MTDRLLQVRDLTVRFPARGRDHKRIWTSAVNHASFDIKPGETLGLVGESGSGKTTIARTLLGLETPHGGEVDLDGIDLLSMRGRPLRDSRRRVQMVFQDPYSSLDPSMMIGKSIGEPLKVHSGLGKRARNQRVAELLDLVGLQPEHMDRYPYEFSGGQRQRIAIARAIATNPDLVILDEPVSALDVSTQNRILELLEDIQQKLNAAYLLISHDLMLVSNISHRALILYLGNIVEAGSTERLFQEPVHPYTKALLSAVPVPDPKVQRSRERIILKGEPPDPTNLPPGCPFQQRCPEAVELCRVVKPPIKVTDDGGFVACHTPWLDSTVTSLHAARS